MEVRTGQDPYDLTYEYDQGGNRTMKIDESNGSFTIRVEYHYDVEEPAGGTGGLSASGDG